MPCCPDKRPRLPPPSGGAYGSEENRLVDRGDGCALIGFRRAACDLVAAAVAVCLLHFAQHMQNADRIEVVHRLCVLAVADDRMVACERENRINAEAGRGQDVAP